MYHRLCLVEYFVSARPSSAYILFNFFHRILAVQKRHHVGGNSRVGVVQTHYLVTVFRLDSQPSTAVGVHVLYKSHCPMIAAAEIFVGKTSTSHDGAVQEPTRRTVEVHFVFSTTTPRDTKTKLFAKHLRRCMDFVACRSRRERINTSVYRLRVPIGQNITKKTFR